jgi:hypothetical protein
MADGNKNKRLQNGIDRMVELDSTDGSYWAHLRPARNGQEARAHSPGPHGHSVSRWLNGVEANSPATGVPLASTPLSQRNPGVWQFQT